MTPAGFPHSDTPGSQLGCQLPRAYRRLQRPSSALDAKASTVCPLQLVNTNTQQKLQRHTLQKQTHDHAQQPPTNPPHKQEKITRRHLRASCRCSRPLSKFQTPRKHQTQHPPKEAGLISQGPTVCQLIHQRAPPRFPHPQQKLQTVLRSATRRLQRSSMIPLVNTTIATWTDARRAGHVLLRKEVIQPHLPVRLPCYDFVPIASPTFDGSLHKGWATGFGCCRLS